MAENALQHLARIVTGGGSRKENEEYEARRDYLDQKAAANTYAVDYAPQPIQNAAYQAAQNAIDRARSVGTNATMSSTPYGPPAPPSFTNSSSPSMSNIYNNPARANARAEQRSVGYTRNYNAGLTGADSRKQQHAYDMLQAAENRAYKAMTELNSSAVRDPSNNRALNQDEIDAAIDKWKSLKTQRQNLGTEMKAASFTKLEDELVKDPTTYRKLAAQGSTMQGDLTHQHINDAQYRNTVLINAGRSENIGSTYYDPYAFMDANERNLYNALYAKDKKKAQEYLGFILPDLNKRRTNAEQARITQVSEKYPVLSSIVSVAESIPAGAGFLYGAIAQGAAEDYDPNSGFFDPARSNRIRRGTVSGMVSNAANEAFANYVVDLGKKSGVNIQKESVKAPIIGEAASFLYGTGMSIADFLTLAAVAPGHEAFTLAVMGTGAASTATLDALDRGASKSDSLKYGFFQGLAEVLFEKLSLDNFVKMTSATAKGAVIKNILKQSGIETSEEIATEIASTLSDNAIMKEKSNYNVAVQQYMQEGMSREDAERKASADIASNILMAGLGGFLSGFVTGSAGQVRVNRISNTSQQQAIADVVRSDPAKYASAHTILQQMDSGAIEKTPTNYGEMLNAYVEDGGDVADISKRITQNAVKERIAQNAKIASSGLVASEDSELYQSRQTAQNSPVATPSNRTSEARTENAPSQTASARLTENGMPRFEDTDGGMTLRTADGIETDAESMEFSTPEMREVYMDASELENAAMANAYVSGYSPTVNGREVSTEDYSKAFRTVSEAGRVGTPYEDVVRSSLYAQNYLDDNGRQYAYAAGLQEAQAQQQTAPAAETAPATGKQSGHSVGRVFERVTGISGEGSIHDVAQRYVDKMRQSLSVNGYTNYGRKQGISKLVSNEMTRYLNEMRQNPSRYSAEDIAAAEADMKAVQAELVKMNSVAQKSADKLNRNLKKYGLKVTVDESLVSDFDGNPSDRGYYDEKTRTVHVSALLDTKEAVFAVAAHEVFHSAERGSARAALLNEVLAARDTILKSRRGVSAGGALISSATEGDYVRSYMDLLVSDFGLTSAGSNVVSEYMTDNSVGILDALNALYKQDADTFWTYFNKKNGDNAHDYIREEMAAHFIEQLAGQNGNAIIRELTKGGKNPLTKFADALRRLLNRPGTTPGQQEAYRSLLDAIERGVAAESSTEAQNVSKGATTEVSSDSGALFVDSNGDPILRHSVDTSLEPLGLVFQKNADGVTELVDENGHVMTEDEVTPELIMKSGYGAILNESMSIDDHANTVATGSKDAIISKQSARDVAEVLAETVRLMIRTQDIDLVWAVNSTVGFHPIQPGRRSGDSFNPRESPFGPITTNSDKQYGSTIDFTTVCLKTQAIIDSMSRIMTHQKRGLTADEVINVVYKELALAGEPVPCPVCYVFSHWVGLGGLLDSMYKMQEQYPEGMDLSEIRSDLAKLKARIDSMTKGKFSENKAELQNQLNKRKAELDRIDQLHEMKVEGARALTAAEKRELAEVNKQLQYIDQYAWLNDVRLKDDYTPVPSDILFDLNAGREFAKHEAAWKYRSSRGQGYGKVTAPYSDANLGQIIRGIATKTSLTQHTIGDLSKDPFLYSENGELNKDAKKMLRKAILNAAIQNLANGERMQSTSDVRFEYGLDYLMALFELQCIGAKVQLYTKVPEAVPMLATANAEVNCSLMPYGDGHDGNGHLLCSDVTGMHPDDAFMFTAMYDNVQPIMVGINNTHIRLLMQNAPYVGADGKLHKSHFSFIIPFHASGGSYDNYVSMMKSVEETVKERTDYTEYQNDINNPEATPEQKAARSARVKIITGNASSMTEAERNAARNNPVLSQLHIRFYGTDIDGNAAKADRRYLNPGDRSSGRDSEAYQHFVTRDIAEKVMPFEFWDKTVTEKDAKKNGDLLRSYCESLGLIPRFSGINSKTGKYDADYDFTNEDGYWMVIPDRRMYNNDGSYHVQKPIDISGVQMGYLRATDEDRQAMDRNITKPSKQNTPERVNELADRIMGELSEYRANKEREAAQEKAAAAQQMAEKGRRSRDITFATSDVTPTAADEEYMEAVRNGDMETAQRIINEAAERALKDGAVFTIADDSGVTSYKLHRGPAPKKTMIVYKTFQVDDDGNVYATYAGVNQPMPKGIWLDAVAQEYVVGADGNKYIPGTTGTAPKLAGLRSPSFYGFDGYTSWLSYRPAFHASLVPAPLQMRVLDPNTGKKTALPHNKLIFRVEVSADRNYQNEARAAGASETERRREYWRNNAEYRETKRAADLEAAEKAAKKSGRPFNREEWLASYDAKGESVIGQARDQLDKVPEMGYYTYRNQGADWVLAGSFRVLGVASEEEIRKVNEENGVRNSGATRMDWLGGYKPEDFGLEDLVLKEGEVPPPDDPRYKRMKLADPITYNDDGEIILPSERFNTKKNDIRFSRDVELPEVRIRQLTRENEKLREALSLLREQFKLTGGHKLDIKAIDRLAGQVLKQWSSNYDRAELASEMKVMFDFIGDAVRNGGDTSAAMDEVFDYGISMAKAVLQQSNNRDTTYYDMTEDVRDYLRSVPIRLTDKQEQEAKNTFGSYANFRRALQGKVNISRNGRTSLDSLWREMNAKFPGVFDTDVKEGTQLEVLYNTVMAMYDRPVRNPYGHDMDRAAMDLFLSIYDAYSDIPEVKTFADKQAEKLEKLREQYKEKIKAIRQESKAQYEERLKALRKENAEKRQELSRQYNEAKKAQHAEDVERLEKLKARYRALNERMLEQRARYRELNIARREREERAKVLQRVARKANTMLTWLDRPNESRHVPEVLRRTVYNFLRTIDVAGDSDSKAAQRWRERMRDLYDLMARADYAEAENESELLYLNVDPDYVEQLHEFLNGTRNVTDVQSMTEEQLRELDFLLDIATKAVRDVNTAMVNGRRVFISELGERAIEAADSNRGSTSNNAIRKLLSFSNIKPIYFFKRVGGSLQELNNDIRKAQSRFGLLFHEAQQYYDEQYRKYNVAQWLDKPGDTLTFTTQHGDEITLTRNQALSLYATAKRDQMNGDSGSDHLSVGGFVYEGEGRPAKGKKPFETAKPKPLSRADMDEIRKFLTDEQMEFADTMVGYMSSDLSKIGNETSMLRNGVKKFTEPYYFPFRSSQNFVYTQPGQQQDNLRWAHKGFTRATKAHANNPIILQNFTDVVASHTHDMLMYATMSIPQENLLRVYNYHPKFVQGKTAQSVKTALEAAYGKPANEYISRYIADLSGNVMTDPRESFVGRMTSKFKKGAVLASLSVAIQQPSAIVRATAYVKSRYFRPYIRKGAYAEAMKYSGIAVIKQMGGFDTTTGRGAQGWFLTVPPEGAKNKLWAFLSDKNYRDDVMGWLPQKMDEITWGAIWDACRREVSATTNLKVGTDEYFEAVAARFDDVIEYTQVYDSVVTRSDIMRSKSGVLQMATAFLAEPTVSFNMLYDAMTEAKKGNKAFAARAVAAVVGQMLFNAALKSIIYALRDDDDDQNILEKYIEAFIGSLIGKPAKRIPYIGQYLYLDGELSPLGLVPFARDILSLAEGYDVERADMSLFGDLIDAFDNMDSENKSNYDKWSGLVGTIAAFFGLPVKNVLRDATGIYNTVRQAIVSPVPTHGRGLLDAVKAGAGIDGMGTITGYYNAIIDARKAGDQAYADQLEKNLKTGAYDGMTRTQKDVDLKVSEALSGSDPRVKKAAEYQIAGNQTARMSLIREIMKDGFSQDIVVGAVNRAENAIRKAQAEPKEQTDEEYEVNLYKSADLTEEILQGQSQELTDVYDYLKETVSESTLKSAVSGAKDEYLSAVAAGSSEAQSIEGALKQIGSEKSAVNWAESAYKEAVTEGNQSEANAYRSALKRLGYDTEKLETITHNAEQKSEIEKFKEQNPGLAAYDLQNYEIANYLKNGKPAGISAKVYIDFDRFENSTKADVDKNGDSISGSKKTKVLNYINSLGISSAQKDALYYAAGYAESKIKDAPWH